MTVPKRVLLVGGGNMGAAMAHGWLDRALAPAGLTVLDPNAGAPLQPLIEKGARHVTEAPSESFDVVVVAVKPQVMEAALPALRPALSGDTPVVSVAAGKTVSSIERLLGERPVVRAMPNTPAMIGRGITGAYCNQRVTAEQRAMAQTLLEASGPVEWVEREGDIDLVTGVSGSGPAYVFLLAEAMAAAGAKLGLSPELAMRLARHTVAGAGELMIRSDDEPATLRRNVTSPNGTTAAALAVLMEPDGLEPLMQKAIAAAARRAAELSKD